MELTYDTLGPVALAVQVGTGDIEVRAEDTPTTRIEISGYDRDHPPRVSCDPTPNGGHRVTIEYRTNRTWGFSFGKGLAARIVVPTGATLEISSGSAELDARGTLHAITVRSGSGDLRFDDVTGDVQIACASGDVEGRSIGGHLSFKGASGDIAIGSVSTGVTVRSASGDIQIGRLDGTSTITVASGDIEVRDIGAGSVKVRAIAGDVQVGVREGMGVWLDVSSSSGDVHSSLEPAARGEQRETPELELTVNTVSGDVEIGRVGSRR